MLSFIWRFRPGAKNPQTHRAASEPLRLTDRRTPTQAGSHDTDPLSLSLPPQSGLPIDEVNYSISLTSRSHRGQLHHDCSSPTWAPRCGKCSSTGRITRRRRRNERTGLCGLPGANLACRERVWRIKPDEIYIWSSLQTCIVPGYCVSSAPPPSSRRVGRARTPRLSVQSDAPGMLRSSQELLTVSRERWVFPLRLKKKAKVQKHCNQNVNNKNPTHAVQLSSALIIVKCKCNCVACK